MGEGEKHVIKSEKDGHPKEKEGPLGLLKFGDD